MMKKCYHMINFLPFEEVLTEFCLYHMINFLTFEEALTGFPLES